jgi:hypothetical protein
MSSIRSVIGGLTVTLACMIFASAQADTPHNFVLRQPPAATAGAPYRPEFVDTATIRRDGDFISVDLLHMNWTYRSKSAPAGTLRPDPEWRLYGQTDHLRFSCAWWTEAQPPGTITYSAEGIQSPGISVGSPINSIIGANHSDASLIDQLCSNAKFDSSESFSSVTAAIAWAKPYMTQPGSPPTLGPPPMTAPRQGAKVTEAAWMAGERSHRFVQIAVADPDGATLYLDAANLKREGSRLKGLSLVILGRADQRGYASNPTANAPERSVVALRQVSYDCIHPSMTVEAQAVWNRFGESLGETEIAFAPRSGSSSAAIASEISAACSAAKPKPSAQTFATVDDAWAYARSVWPPNRRVWKESCIWEHVPPDVQNASAAAIIADERPNLGMSEASYVEMFHACGVPDAEQMTARQRFSRYGFRQAALEYFRTRHDLTEAQLYKAWMGISWHDRQRIPKSQMQHTSEELAAANEIVSAAAATLGLSSDDDRRMFSYFIGAQAFLDAD